MTEPNTTIAKVAAAVYDGYDTFSDVDKQTCEEFVSNIVTSYLDNLQLSKTSKDNIDYWTGQVVDLRKIFDELSGELKKTYPEA